MRWRKVIGLGALVVVGCGVRNEGQEEVSGQQRAALIDCSGLAEWTVRTYGGGDRVRHGDAVYECKPFPYSGWCGQVGYEPGVTASWSDAWLRLDSCAPNGTGGSGSGGAGGTGAVGTVVDVTAYCPDAPEQCCPAGYNPVPLTPGADVYQTGQAQQCIVALGGINNVAAQGNDEIVIGGPDTDIIQAANGNNIVVPGPGVDLVSTGTGNDTAYIFDLCELQAGDTLDMGSGYDTLVAPAPLAELQARGLNVTNVEEVVVQRNPCRSLCGQTHCLRLPPRSHLVTCSINGSCTFTQQIPDSSAPEDVALSASKGLTLNAGAFVKEPIGRGAPVVVSGGGTVTVAVDGHVGQVVTDGPVVLGSRAHVDGRVVAGGAVTQGDAVVVTDGVTESAPFDSLRVDSWTIAFPTTNQDVALAPNTQGSLVPGGFRALAVRTGATVSLAAGTYTFDSVLLEPGARLTVDNTNGPTHVAIRSALTLHGRVAATDEQRHNLRFSFAGSSPVVIDAPFFGTLVAPAATINVAAVDAPGHRGAIFANVIDLAAVATFEHHTFRDEVCQAGQCRPITPKPTTTSVGALSKTLTWKTAVPVVQLSDSFQNVRSLQTSCRIARELCFDTREACANEDPTACDDELVCAQANDTCAPLYAADAAPGYTAATDPSLKFLRSSEVANALGISPTVDSLRFAGSDGRSLIYKHFVDVGHGQRVPVLGSQVVLRPSEDETSVQRVASTLLGGFSVPAGTLMTADAAIDLAISHVSANDLFDFDDSPTASETTLTAVRHAGRDFLAYLVPFQSPGLPGFIGGRVMVDGTTGDIVLARDIADLAFRPAPGDFGPPIKQVDPRLFQLLLQNLACREDGRGLDRFGQERLFSTSLLPTGVGNEMVYGTVSCNEIDDLVDPPLHQFDVATFIPAVQEDLREPGFVPIEDAYKMVYSEEENEFFETSAVEAQFWGSKISQYYRQLNAQYGVGPGEIADYRSTPDGNGALPRIRMLSVVDFPGLTNGKWFPPVTNETSIAASNGIAVFGSSDADLGLRAWTDPGVIAHEFFHSVLYDHTGILGEGDPKDSPAIAEGLADCFEMLATHKFKSIMSHDPDVGIDPFHLKQGVFVDSEQATKGQPSLAFPPDSALGVHEYWAGQRTPDADGHRNSTLLSGVCKILITGGVNPVLGGDVNNFHAGDMAVIPLPYGDPGQTSLTQNHEGLVEVDQEANMSHLEELLVSTVQSGKITPASDFRDVIEAFATEAEDLAIKNQRAHNGRWDDDVLYESFPHFVRLAFSTYGWGRLQESSSKHGPNQVAALDRIASLNLIGANEANPEPIEGCVCSGDQDFFVLNERVRPGDTIHFAVESNGQIATRIFVNDPCNGFAFNPEEECGGELDLKNLRYVYPDVNSLPECKVTNQIYPELCAPEDPEHIPQSGSVEYDRSGHAIVFIGVTNGPMGGDRNYKLKAWIHHKHPLRAPSN